ncbi:MAG: DUF4440 domain-containing protein [Gammaproteobacteria bacterium]|nr:DUF4440 domain-containing protein [Gammaproteobacteria bacterium]
MRLTTCVLAVLCLTACEDPIVSYESAVIESRVIAWEQALNNGDVDALVEMYTRNARVLSPNKEMTAGSDAVRAEFGGMVGAGLVGDITTVEARHAGDIGYHVGLYTLGTADGGVIDRGKFIEIWRLEDDGHWRISNDIFNSDLPVDAGHDEKHEEGAGHTTVTLIHEVNDPATWLAAWRNDDRRELFKQHGAIHVHAFQDRANPGMTGLVVAVRDMAAFEAFLDSDAAAAAAAADGVRLDTMRMFSEISH